MSNYKIIVPEATTNLFTDPVFGADDPDTAWDISATGGSSPDVTKTQSDVFVGDGCAEFDFDGATDITLKIDVTVTATSYTLTCYAKRSGGGAIASSHLNARFNTANSAFDSYTLIRDDWYYCVKTGTATAGSREFGVFVRTDGMLIDGLQLENKAYATTLAYGSKAGNLSDGYEWTGQAHASTSTRSAQERSGGRVRDVVDDLSVTKVQQIIGAGAFPDNVLISPTAQLPGGIYNNNKIQPRIMDMALIFEGSTTPPHVARNTFYDAIRARLTTPIQPFTLRYEAGTEPVEIDTRLMSGMGGIALTGNLEKTNIRLVSENPYWRSIGNEVKVLDTNDSITTNYIVQRQSDGTWSNLATSINNTVRALAKTSDRVLYIGGDMTAPGNYTVSWDGSSMSALSTGPGAVVNAITTIGTTPYVGKASSATLEYWNGSTWTATTSGSNSNVKALLTDPNDNIYVGGTANILDYWDGAAWTKVCASTANGTVRAILVDGTDIYFGGDFTTIGGVSAARFAKLDTTDGTWSQPGAIGNGSVYALAKFGDDIWIGGSFTNIGGASGDYLIYYDGSSLNSITSPPNQDVYAISEFTVSSVDYLIIGGDFTSMGGGSPIRMAYESQPKTSGGWSGIGTGANNTVRAFSVSSDGGTLYIGGQFTSFNGVSNTNGVCSATDFSNVTSITTASMVEVTCFAWLNNNLYIGGSFTNAGDASGDFLVYYDGSSLNSIDTGVPNGGVEALAVSGNRVYLGGGFTNLENVNGDYIAYTDGSTFTTIQTGLSSTVFSLATRSDGDIIAGGNFTNAPGDRIVNISIQTNHFYGTAFTDESNITVNDDIYGIAQDSDEALYIVGDFNHLLKIKNGIGELLGNEHSGDARAIAIDPTTGNIWVSGTSGMLLYWNGQRETTVVTSTTDNINAIAFDSSGGLYVGGNFTTIGSLTATGLAYYSGGVWSMVDIDLPASSAVQTILIDGSEVTVGFNTAGSSAVLGTTTVTNNGTTDAYPIVTFTGPGDLRQLRNETTGKQIQFTGLTLGASETVTLDLRQFEKNLTSDSRIPENINSKIQQSDLIDFSLLPGDNDIGVLVTDASSTATMTWTMLHESFDGAQ